MLNTRDSRGNTLVRRQGHFHLAEVWAFAAQDITDGLYLELTGSVVPLKVLFEELSHFQAKDKP